MKSATSTKTPIPTGRIPGRKLPRTRNGRIKDFQRSRVYDWEDAWIRALEPERFDHEKMSLPECRRLIVGALKRYGLDTGFQLGDGRGAAWARGGFSRIKLPRWARRPSVVLHETAHMICHRVMYASQDRHGPAFMAVFCDLIGWHFKVNAQLVARCADGCGLLVAWGDACPQPKAKAKVKK